MPTEVILNDLEGAHYAQWLQARDEHRAESAKHAAFRLASLESSYRARIALLQDQLGKATDERIQRMHRSQIERAVAEHAQRVQDVERAKETVDLQADLVAFGTIPSGGGECGW